MGNIRLPLVTRITIENFMSHRRSVIEPGEGLTVLTGPNNCGKSAVVLALQTLCSNERGMSKFVRHGQKQARVAVETSDRHKIEWVFEGGSVRYVVDGVRTDRSVVPDDMMPKLRLPEVCGDDGKTFDIHFSDQKDPIFLLGGGSRAATFFAASTDAGYLVKMQQLLRARKVEQNSLQRELRSRVVVRERQLEPFETLPEIEAELGFAQRAFEELGVAVEGTVAMERLAAALTEAERRRAREGCLMAAMGELMPTPALEDEAGLRSLGEKLVMRQLELDAAAARKDAVLELTPLPALEDPSGLRSLIEEMASRERQSRLLGARLACVEGIEAPAPIVVDSILEQTVVNLEGLLAKVKAAKAQTIAASQEAEAAFEALRRYVSAHPTCPVCGQPIDADAVASGGHAHA